MSKRMKWRTKDGGATWQSDRGYRVEGSRDPIARLRVIAPGGHRIGSANELLGAQQIANDHAHKGENK